MKLFEAAQYLREELKEVYDEPEAANISVMVLEGLIGLEKNEQVTRKDLLLSKEQINTLQEQVTRLKKHEPVQYLLNRAWFYGMPLYVDHHVLIPRPETEELVDWVVKDVKSTGRDVFEKKPGEADETRELKILDVGTGSGCLALALKKAMPGAEVWGCDVSEPALNVARRNGSELDIRVDFQFVDFLDPVQQKFLPTVDLIVSNPPYVPLQDKEAMHPNVLLYEPHRALFVDNNDPLLFYKALAQFGKQRLYPGGRLYIEIHESLGQEVVALFRQEGYDPVELRKDMQGKDRMVRAGRESKSSKQ
jgi:release factor glutamine methyltransferase